MRWLKAGMAPTALLCQIYLTLVASLILWTIFPLFLGWTPTVVISGSMEPRILVGDVIFADPMDSLEIRKTVKKNHVLLVQDPSDPSKLVTHRVVEIFNSGEAYITKGDANAANDSTPIPVENVLGIEKLRIPYIGIPIYSLQKANLAMPGLFVFSLILSQIIVRKQWAAESLARKHSESVLPEEASIDREKSSHPLTGASSPNDLYTRDRPRVIFWARTFSLILVPLLLIFSSLALSPSAALWKGETSNSVNVFEACHVFKKNNNQNTSGSNCGNNGN